MHTVPILGEKIMRLCAERGEQACVVIVVQV